MLKENLTGLNCIHCYWLRSKMCIKTEQSMNITSRACLYRNYCTGNSNVTRCPTLSRAVSFFNHLSLPNLRGCVNILL
jgi:hypothetical protein